LAALFALILAGCATPERTSEAAGSSAVGNGTSAVADLTAINPDGPLKVVATTSIIGDVARQVGGDQIDLTVLLPAGSDPHAWVPSPQDLVTLSNADLLLINGVGLEEGLLPILDTISGPQIVSVNEHVDIYMGEEEAHDHADEGHADDEHTDEAHTDEAHTGEAHTDDDEHAHDDHDEDHIAPEDVHDLASWAGEWESGFSLLNDPAAADMTTEIATGMDADLQEVQAVLDAFLMTDFDTATIHEDAVVFATESATVECSYDFAGVEETEFEGTSFHWYTFSLSPAESTAHVANSCDGYRNLLFTLPHGEGEAAHFHMRYGNADVEALMGDPDLALWWPSLFPESLGADQFVALMGGADSELALFVASVLGADTASHTEQAPADEEHSEETHAAEEHAEEHDDHDHSAGDPHTWQDVANVRIWAEDIAGALSALDPANKDVYGANADAYRAQLAALADEIAALMEDIPADARKLVTDHDDLGYFARAHGFTVVGTIIPSISAMASVSAQAMAALQDQIAAEGVQAIFVGNTVNRDLADQIAADTGVQIVPLFTDALSAEDGPAPTYVDMMRYNANAIAEALAD